MPGFDITTNGGNVCARRTDHHGGWGCLAIGVAIHARRIFSMFSGALDVNVLLFLPWLLNVLLQPCCTFAACSNVLGQSQSSV